MRIYRYEFNLKTFKTEKIEYEYIEIDEKMYYVISRDNTRKNQRVNKKRLNNFKPMKKNSILLAWSFDSELENEFKVKCSKKIQEMLESVVTNYNRSIEILESEINDK